MSYIYFEADISITPGNIFALELLDTAIFEADISITPGNIFALEFISAGCIDYAGKRLPIITGTLTASDGDIVIDLPAGVPMFDGNEVAIVGGDLIVYGDALDLRGAVLSFNPTFGLDFAMGVMALSNKEINLDPLLTDFGSLIQVKQGCFLGGEFLPQSHLTDADGITPIIIGTITFDEVVIDVVYGQLFTGGVWEDGVYNGGDRVETKDGYFFIDDEYLDLTDATITITDDGE